MATSIGEIWCVTRKGEVTLGYKGRGQESFRFRDELEIIGEDAHGNITIRCKKKKDATVTCLKSLLGSVAELKSKPVGARAIRR